MVVTEKETEYVTIPEAWLEACPIPALEGTKNRDLWAAFEARGTALEECNAKLETIRLYQRFHAE